MLSTSQYLRQRPPVLHSFHDFTYSRCPLFPWFSVRIFSRFITIDRITHELINFDTGPRVRPGYSSDLLYNVKFNNQRH